jgi:hypothetical protein
MHGPDTGVALYFADQLGKYISVPFGSDTMMAERFENILDTVINEYAEVLRETLLTDLDEAARWKIVKLRIRNGKVQRRKKVSTLSGFTFRKKGGSTVFMRIPTTERIRRRIGARRAKIKRRAHLSRSKQRRKRSLIKLRGLGVR